MMTNRKATLLVAVLWIVCAAAAARAVCDQSSASQADSDLWNIHGCWEEFFLWQYQFYGMSATNWGDRGWNDACNVNLEYPKHWNASYLVGYGMLDSNDLSFHGTEDYETTSGAGATNFHDNITHAPTDDTSIFGGFDPNTNVVTTSCLLYDSSSPNANPGSRVGDFLHEGWHAWMKKYNYGWGDLNCGGHRCGPFGSCTFKSCDYFYFHGIGAYAFGAMWQNDGTANRFHSPNQVQVEFLCDVSELPQSWVPASVRLSAEADANQRSSERFINGPGFYCGDPRPW
ncbi:MAG: hypothetical protein QOH25_4138 [Acidobacteriota bacterium]|nr:hypothetical protein [Acidobacteriota bacterium]